jgi:hypothetical protein
MILFIFIIWLWGLILTNFNIYIHFIDQSSGDTIEDYVKFVCDEDLEMLLFFSMFPIGGLLTALISFFIVWPLKLFNKIKHVKIRL